MCDIAIVVSVRIVGSCCIVIFIAIWCLLGMFAMYFWCCHCRLIRTQLEALRCINPIEMGWGTEGIER